MNDATPLLGGIRVLDLATERAELTGRLLADLGADVLKVEPPRGVAARRRPPFDKAGASLYWASVGVGKQSAVIDLGDAAGRERVRALAARADVLVESFDPGYMSGLRLGYDELRPLNPSLIYVSVTPFGQKGPKAAWPATDLTLEAAAGRVGLQGDRDRPPIPVGYPQASFHAGARAAADAVIALNERAVSGLGQHLDMSMLETVVFTLLASAGFPHYTGGEQPGFGDDRAEAPAPQPGAFLGRAECADGYVVVTATSNAQLVRCIPETVLPALDAAGRDTSALRALDWEALVAAIGAHGVSDADLTAALEAVRDFFKLKTKRELIEWAWTNDVHLGPSNTTADLLANPHLRERGYWQQVGSRTQPGLSVRASRSPIVIQRPAPRLGEHQDAVDRWLESQPQRVEAAGTMRQERLGEAFSGLKVADFSWVAVGPITAKALADHGATVVRIESSTRVDYVRTLPPFKDNEPGIDRGHYMANLNSSKLGVALNLRTAAGRMLARRLADWADVIVENYTPGTMKRLGLDYQTLSRDKPELIMISTCLMGQTGPWASFAGYGPHGAAISGLHQITGWPDRPPAGPYGPYTDVIAPHYAISALAAAILERRQSGLGQHLDVSQV
ncbi:MAG TPA: CoA transferase, partial [Dehalococcoidia bacterium]|nr:CoA transferase [Dehalococcoidia bacterium]